MVLHDIVSNRLSRLGSAWLSAVLITIALFLVFIALTDQSVTHKAIVATWVLMP